MHEVVALGSFTDPSPQLLYPNPVGVPSQDLGGFLDDGFDAPLLRVMSFIPAWTPNAEWVSEDYGTGNMSSTAAAFHE